MIGRFALTLNVAPVPKGRARALHGAGRRTRLVTPARTVEFEQTLRLAAQAARPKGWELEGAFRVELVVRRARRAGDIDNHAKSCLDALNGVAWRDDVQVLELHAVLEDKKDQVPGVTLTVHRLNNGEST